MIASSEHKTAAAAAAAATLRPTLACCFPTFCQLFVTYLILRDVFQAQEDLILDHLAKDRVTNCLLA
jgi:hypothetical protein